MANMGTNLSQVFIANDAVTGPTSGSAFNSLATAAASTEVGVWDVVGGAYHTTALYSTGVDITDEVAGAATDEVLDDITTVANPLWLKSRIQLVQGASGQPIATPLIDTRSIRSIRFEPYVATAGHKVVITPDTTFTDASVNTVTIKVIMRTLPVDQLSYHDGDGTDYTILSGSDPLPLGVFNATNHKSVSVEFNCTSSTTFVSAGKTAIDNHNLLSKIVSTTNTGSGTSLDLQSKHVGVIFDVVVQDADGHAITAAVTANNKVVLGTTGQVLGVGNPWQVLGEEIRCRSRYGNFNRMYLPQNQTTYTLAGNEYSKVTISYEHNWPTSTGIAPAGTLNQAVLYIGDSAGQIAAGDTNIDTIFAISDMAAAQEFVW